MKLHTARVALMSLFVLLGCSSISSQPQETEYIAGFIFYKFEGGSIEYLMLQKIDELDDWSPPKGI
jgi:hypothetical protein